MSSTALSMPTVGVFHSAIHLANMIAASPLTVEETVREFRRILVCPPQVVLNLAQQCRWIEFRGDGVVILSRRGGYLCDIPSYKLRLREQLSDYITSAQPPWARLIPRGREELIQYASVDCAQLFREAGLLEKPPSHDVVDWWDRIGDVLRRVLSSGRIETGRIGERLSIDYERNRTGRDPTWQSVESNLSGFDVLSTVSPSDRSPLRIEVKASKETLKSASFFISRNEWCVASSSGAHVFHLWSLGNRLTPQLAVVSVQAIVPHIPQDRGCGKWRKSAIAFVTFEQGFVTQSKRED